MKRVLLQCINFLLRLASIVRLSFCEGVTNIDVWQLEGKYKSTLYVSFTKAYIIFKF